MPLRCVVVTPERTQLDQAAASLVLPMADGALGVLPGRAPLVGRLGYGILKIVGENGTTEWFVDGGFVQIEKDLVSILTSRVVPPSSIDAAAAEKSLDEALALPSNNLQRSSAVARARGQVRVAARK
jgi:F-type H+-transporting ATPase subunit epsilon